MSLCLMLHMPGFTPLQSSLLLMVLQQDTICCFPYSKLNKLLKISPPLSCRSIVDPLLDAQFEREWNKIATHFGSTCLRDAF